MPNLQNWNFLSFEIDAVNVIYVIIMYYVYYLLLCHGSNL